MFYRNLICNLIEKSGYRRRDKIVLYFESSLGLSSFLEDIHIPFLFPPDNCNLPSVLHPTSFALNYYSSSIHVGKFRSSANIEEIDATFKFFKLDENGTIRKNLNLQICSIECKNWRSNLLIGDLNPILTRMLICSSKLGIIVCNLFGGFLNSMLSSFRKFCFRMKSSTILDIERVHFNVVPFHPSMEFIENFNLNCIIIELSVPIPSQ